MRYQHVDICFSSKHLYCTDCIFYFINEQIYEFIVIDTYSGVSQNVINLPRTCTVYGIFELIFDLWSYKKLDTCEKH